VGILLILAVGCTGGGDGLDLRLNLEAGQSFGLKMVMDQKIDQDVQGQKVAMTQQMGVGYTFAVESVEPDGTAWVKTTYDWVMMKHDTPMGKTEYDSANPPEEIPLMAKGSATLVGNSISMLLEPKGTVLEVKGLDALFQKMLEEIDIPQGPAFEGVEKQLKDQFGDDALKEMMRNMMTHFPDEPVQVGDSWDQKVVIAKGFPMIIETTHTLREHKDGVAIIDNESTIRPNPDASPLEMGTTRMRYELSGTQKGTTRIDVATGMPLGAELTQTFEGQVNMEMAGTGDGQSQGWPMSVVSTVTIGPLEK
jgi:hypothetical protein